MRGRNSLKPRGTKRSGRMVCPCNQVVCDLGGVHASTAGTCTTATIGAGSHPLDLFFVDINSVQSGLTFGINTSNVTTTPDTSVPEPATLTFGFGLATTGGSRPGRTRK